jgi:trichothecene 3-O-acetyltransferase
MPRAYIRVCLAYRVPSPEAEAQALLRLEAFVRRILDAKPYLAGWVVAAKDPGQQEGKVEVRFTVNDLDDFPCLQTRSFSHDEIPFDYQQLDRDGLPPSAIKPELVSALPESADEDRAPAFRVQANLVDGGLIVSFYLHHCISDGTGMGLLISGDILHDDFAFQRDLKSSSHTVPDLSERLACFAKLKSVVRGALSWSSPNLLSDRHIDYKHALPSEAMARDASPPGRGCIFTFPDEKLSELRASLKAELTMRNPALELTTTDALQTLLWHHMTLARRPSLIEAHGTKSSKLLTPVDIRKKLDKDKCLDDNYFGSAVDFSCAELSLEHLQRTDHASMTFTALAVHEAIRKVDDSYVRAAIALANSTDPTVDVRDLQASNMNRSTGADMYITSWKNLRLYEADLDLGLGPPDWVRKPWSKDPGSCIIMPKDPRKHAVEVVVQMTEDDMARLLMNQQFISMVSRVIE